MPAFLVSAMALLARAGLVGRSALIGGPGRALATGAGAGALVTGGLGIPGVDLFPDRPRRRRRRRALTASDRADIGFITGLLGTTAGKQFAITIATRS